MAGYSLKELIRVGELYLHLWDRIYSGDASASLHLKEIQSWVKEVEDWASANSVTIPDKGNSLQFKPFDLWEVPTRDFMQSLLGCLKACEEEKRFELIKEHINANEPVPKHHVFLSYVRENTEEVERLRDYLDCADIKVWLDRDSIIPGRNWKEAVREAIEKGSFFIACFSKESVNKVRAHMNEEFTLAIEEIRQRQSNKSWFIPVKLSPCDIPDRDIGAGKRLSHLQFVELYPDFEGGVLKIIDIMKPLPLELKNLITLLFSPFIKDRISAAERLYRQFDVRTLAALIKALYDPNSEVSYWIVKALRAIRHPRAMNALLEALDDPDWPGSRSKLIEEVESFDNEECRKAVRAYLERQRDRKKYIKWLIRKKKKTDE